LRRYPLKDEIETRRRNGYPQTSYFGSEPVFSIDLISYEGDIKRVSPKDILICDLSRWQPPSDVSDFKTAVDPEKGRLMLSSDLSSVVKEVLVSYSYGFSADVVQGLLILRTGVRNALRHSVDWRAG
jgi:hypothetical protein